MANRTNRRNRNGMNAKHGRGLTARTRAAVLNCFDLIDDKPEKYRPISELLAQGAQKDVFKFMDIAAKYIIKDINTDADAASDASKLTDNELADIIARRARDRLESTQEPAQAPLAEVNTKAKGS